jgi:acetyltransferase-like isoleucine patch superfamily enzyme
MLKKSKKIIGKVVYKLLLNYKPDFSLIENPEFLCNSFYKSKKGKFTKLNPIYKISDSEIGDYTYIAQNSIISNTIIGKFCSIGPNLVCGWGIHPTNRLSTSPMFYSTLKQNGITLSLANKIDEREPIKIGNDVFIGMNVSILDGVTIGDGAVIGAGAVVSKNIPPYAIAVGCPIKIVKYRFDSSTIESLLKIESVTIVFIIFEISKSFESP